MANKTLAELAGALYDAKRTEDEAKRQRIEIEEAIAALVETGENQSKTVDAAPGLKVLVKRAMSYEADVEAIRKLNLDADILPLELHPPIPAEYGFDEKAYERLREQNPAAWAKVAEHVVAKPRKVSVTLKLA
jgi:hypothetical protein